jgi:hypothetical protein
MCGLVSMLLGWTVIVPCLAWDRYNQTSEMAKRELVAVPVRASIGFAMALLFGAVQTLALVAHLLK